MLKIKCDHHKILNNFHIMTDIIETNQSYPTPHITIHYTHCYRMLDATSSYELCEHLGVLFVGSIHTAKLNPYAAIFG